MNGSIHCSPPRRGVQEGRLLDSSLITITITDNGIGMSPELAARLLSDSHAHSGYGIKNVDARIKLFFGPEYGLSYSSVPGKGTTVSIRIPPVRKDLPETG